MYVLHRRMNESGDEEGEPPLYTEEDLQACLDKIEVIDFQQVGRASRSDDVCMFVWVRCLNGSPRRRGPQGSPLVAHGILRSQPFDTHFQEEPKDDRSMSCPSRLPLPSSHWR